MKHTSIIGIRFSRDQTDDIESAIAKYDDLVNFSQAVRTLVQEALQGRILRQAVGK